MAFWGQSTKPHLLELLRPGFEPKNSSDNFGIPSQKKKTQFGWQPLSRFILEGKEWINSPPSCQNLFMPGALSHLSTSAGCSYFPPLTWDVFELCRPFAKFSLLGAPWALSSFDLKAHLSQVGCVELFRSLWCNIVSLEALEQIQQMNCLGVCCLTGKAGMCWSLEALCSYRGSGELFET